MSITLTKEQEILVEEYYQKMLTNGIKAGVKTDMTDAPEFVGWLYRKYLDREPPTDIRLVSSPMEALKQAGLVKENHANEIIYLNLWSYWVAYYHAGIHILKEDCEKDLVDDLTYYEKMTHKFHAILPCEEACFFIEYPKVISLKDNDTDKFVLHKENGFAIEYSDGFGFGWMNGIEMPDYIVKTPASKLSAKKILLEQNVDVRREGIKKVGLLKTLKAAKAKVLDRWKGRKKWENYALYSTNFGDKERVMLSMVNPSTGDTCIERVDDKCKTVKEALEFRDSEEVYESPKILT